jgi:hypothetical protein
LAHRKSLEEGSTITESEGYDLFVKLEGLHDCKKVSRFVKYAALSAPKEADDAALFLLDKGLPREIDRLSLLTARLIFENWAKVAQALRAVASLAMKFLLRRV